MAAIPSDMHFELVLYLGAGPLFDAGECLRHLDTRCIVIEPDPQVVRRLEQRLDAASHVTVFQGAPAPEDGEAEMDVFNIPGLVSMADPTGLKEDFPGARVLRRPHVPLLSPDSIAGMLGKGSGPRRLVLDAPGTGRAWLEDPRAPGLLHQFDRIDLRTSVEELFSGGQTLSALSELLTGAGFEVCHSDLSDADWGIRSFRIDRQRLRMAELEKALAGAEALAETRAGRITELETRAEAAAQEAAARQARIETLEHEAKAAGTEAAARIAELEKALAEASETAETRAGRIAELETRAEAAAQEAAARQARIETLEHELEAAGDRAARLETAGTEAAARIADLEKALAEASETAETRASRITELETQAETAAQEAAARRKALETSLDQHRSQLEKCKADLSLSVRLQTLTANDLRDLQQSHAALQTQKRQQDSLVGQLVTRLEAASHHLETLSFDALTADAAPPRVADGRKTGKPKAKPGK